MYKQAGAHMQDNNPCHNCIVLAVCRAKIHRQKILAKASYASFVLYLAVNCSLLFNYVDIEDNPDDHVVLYNADHVLEAAESLGLKPTYYDSSNAVSLKQMQYIRGLK